MTDIDASIQAKNVGLQLLIDPVTKLWFMVKSDRMDELAGRFLTREEVMLFLCGIKFERERE